MRSLELQRITLSWAEAIANPLSKAGNYTSTCFPRTTNYVSVGAYPLGVICANHIVLSLGCIHGTIGQYSIEAADAI